MINFDGDNKVITLAGGVFAVDSQDIYSEWKVWVAQGNNAAYLEAFRTIGGDPLGGGLRAGSYFFIQNNLGWRIKPPEEDINITIIGNLFPEDAGTAFLMPTVGDFNTSLRLQGSSLTQTVETGNTDLTPLESKLTTINQGVQKASLLVPHTEDV